MLPREGHSLLCLGDPPTAASDRSESSLDCFFGQVGIAKARQEWKALDSIQADQPLQAFRSCCGLEEERKATVSHQWFHLDHSL